MLSTRGDLGYERLNTCSGVELDKTSRGEFFNAPGEVHAPARTTVVCVLLSSSLPYNMTQICSCFADEGIQ